MNLSQDFKMLVIDLEPTTFEQQIEADADLAKAIGENALAIRLWSFDGIYFGKMDRLLLEFLVGKQQIEAEGIRTCVRRCGGLAVIGDEGVLNLTIIFTAGHPRYGGLQQSYAFANQLMKYLLEDYSVTLCDGEVKGSYCPGASDLSIRGKKIIGIAQYRPLGKVMIMVTLAVNGDQLARSNKIKAFYTTANTGHDSRFPFVDPNSMTTLEETIGLPITTEEVKSRIVERLRVMAVPTQDFSREHRPD